MTYTWLFLILLVACKANFHGSSQPGPENVGKPTPTPDSPSGVTTPKPDKPIINTVINYAMLTVTYPAQDSKLEKIQIKLKGSPNDWQDVSYSTVGEAYVPTLCDADHVSNLSIQGKHNGCAFVVGSTPDTNISNKSLNEVSFDLSEKCDSMQNPTTFILKCAGGPGLKLSAP